MNSEEDYYEILQVSRTAESEVIEAAYRRLSRKYHPDTDKNPGSLKRMQLINKAYETLSDPIRKADYDNKHHKTSDSEKNYQESTRKHSDSKSDTTTTRKGNKRIWWWGISISAIILLFLYLQNSNKEVSTSGIVTPNTKTGEVKQVPGSQFDYAGARQAGYSDAEIQNYLASKSQPQGTYASEVQKVMADGYTPYGMNYNDSFLLHALIGMRTGTADGYDKRAFFFYQGKYLGTDTKSISAMINSPWRDDKTIAIEYTLYKKADPLCCPTGGSKIVRFQWDGNKLNALDPIPTEDWDADLSRR